MNMLIRKAVKVSNRQICGSGFQNPVLKIRRFKESNLTNFTFFVLIITVCVTTHTQAAFCGSGGNFHDAIATERGEIECLE